MPTRRNNRKNRKTQKRGGASRAFYGKITNANGNEKSNANFSKGNNRGFNSYWQDINTALSAHVRRHFAENEIIMDGFGGDDGTGVVVVKVKKALPPMKFTVAGNPYTMTFDRIENNNA